MGDLCAVLCQMRLLHIAGPLRAGAVTQRVVFRSLPIVRSVQSEYCVTGSACRTDMRRTACCRRYAYRPVGCHPVVLLIVPPGRAISLEAEASVPTLVSKTEGHCLSECRPLSSTYFQRRHDSRFHSPGSKPSFHRRVNFDAKGGRSCSATPCGADSQIRAPIA